MIEQTLVALRIALKAKPQHIQLTAEQAAELLAEVERLRVLVTARGVGAGV